MALLRRPSGPACCTARWCLALFPSHVRLGTAVATLPRWRWPPERTSYMTRSKP